MGWPLEEPMHSNIILTQYYRGINKVNPVFSAPEYCISRGFVKDEKPTQGNSSSPLPGKGGGAPFFYSAAVQGIKTGTPG